MMLFTAARRWCVRKAGLLKSDLTCACRRHARRARWAREAREGEGKWEEGAARGCECGRECGVAVRGGSAEWVAVRRGRHCRVGRRCRVAPQCAVITT